MNGTAVTLDGQVLLTWATLVIAVVGAVVAVGRWIIKSLDSRVRDLHDRMEIEVRRATAPIQPDANGSLSLPDVARSLRALAAANDKAHARLHERIDVVVSDVRDLQLWAADRPCLLDRQDRATRARQRLKQSREAGSGDDAGCPDDT